MAKTFYAGESNFFCLLWNILTDLWELALAMSSARHSAFVTLYICLGQHPRTDIMLAVEKAVEAETHPVASMIGSLSHGTIRLQRYDLSHVPQFCPK